MPKRNLRYVKKTTWLTLGICEHCNAKFESKLPNPEKAEWEVKTRFDEHQCKPPLDSSQNALRVVREATENK